MNFIQELHWRPTIGDPTAMGWFTVFAYGLTAFVAWLAARRAGNAPGLANGSKGLWLLVSALMALLCVNKQLDLQSLVTDIARVIAWHQGWYQERREYQRWFVLAAVAGSGLITLLVLAGFWKFWFQHWLLGCGLAFLLTFIVVRAISFHHFDAILKHKIGGMKMNWILEIGGIGLIFIAAYRDFRNPKRAVLAPWQVKH